LYAPFIEIIPTAERYVAVCCQVLFVDGTVTCYTSWQYAVIVYAVACVTPFCLILAFGPELLRRGRLTLTEFFIGCLCPLPVLAVILYRRLREGPYFPFSFITSSTPAAAFPPSRATPEAVSCGAPGYLGDRQAASAPVVNGQQCSSWALRQRPFELGPGTVSALRTLQGPFRDNRYGVCWAGVLVGRRLVLILLYTFVNDALVRLLAMLVFCFIVLLHHVDVQPYRDRRGNAAGTASAAALVILGTINLIR
jgi:hypothetical protein